MSYGGANSVHNFIRSLPLCTSRYIFDNVLGNDRGEGAASETSDKCPSKTTPHTLRLAALSLQVPQGIWARKYFAKKMCCSLCTFHFLLPLRTSFTRGRDWAKVPIFLLEKCEEFGSHIASMSLYRMAQWELFLFQGELVKLYRLSEVQPVRDFQLYRSCISIFVFCIILMHHNL